MHTEKGTRTMLNFTEGSRIPLTQRHIMLADRQSLNKNAIALSLADATGEDGMTAIVFPLHECVGFYKDTGKGKNISKDVGELQTTTTFEDWYCQYMDTGKIQPCEMYIFKQDDPDDDRLWIGVVSDPKPTHKTLVRVVDNEIGKEIETLLLCDRHLAEMQEFLADQAPHKNPIIVVKHLSGSCERCCVDEEQEPITYHPVPESITAHVVFVNGETATWEAHGGVGQIDYLQEDSGTIHTTMQSLKDRGVRTFVLVNRYEVEVD